MKKTVTILLLAVMLFASLPSFASAPERIGADGPGEYPLPAADGPLDGLPEEALVGAGEKAYDGTIDSSACIVLMDADTGTILYEQNPEVQAHPASTTKLMTALIGVESGDLDQYITAGSEVNIGGTWSTMTPALAEGETISLRDMIHGILLPSGCEAAAVLGVAMGGSTSAFASWMNKRARSLGMRGSHFVNANGITNSSHYTTALDMAQLARAVTENEFLRTVVSTHEYHTSPTNKYGARTLVNTNYLIDTTSEYYYPYAVGVKTGTTTTAKYCLVSKAQKNGHSLICVIMHAPTNDARYRYAKNLLEWGFANISRGDTALFFAGCNEVNAKAVLSSASSYYYAPAASPGAYLLGSAESGRAFLIKYSAADASGRLWYFTSEGYFIPASAFADADSQPSWGFCRDARNPLPSGSYESGAELKLRGTVYSDHYINTVSAHLYDWRGELAASCVFEPYRTNFDLVRFEDGLRLAELPAGIYELVMTFRSNSSRYVLRSSFELGEILTVTFCDSNYNVLLRQSVPYGCAAVPPEAPEVEGMRFMGWDRDFSCVTYNMLVTAVYYPESAFIPGDVNGDGALSFADISELYSYLTGGLQLTGPSAVNADFNGDGEVDFADVGAIYSACLNAG